MPEKQPSPQNPLTNLTSTIGFNTWNSTYRRCRIQFFDLGGGRSIREIWPSYFEEAHGLMFIVDAADLSRLSECRKELLSAVSHPALHQKPLLILANKQDLDGALDEMDVCTELGIEELANKFRCPTRLEVCSAVKGKNRKSSDRGIRMGFKWLVETVKQAYVSLNERVEAAKADRQAEEDARKQRRLARMSERQRGNGQSREEELEVEPVSDETPPPWLPVREITTVTARDVPPSSSGSSDSSRPASHHHLSDLPPLPNQSVTPRPPDARGSGGKRIEVISIGGINRAVSFQDEGNLVADTAGGNKVKVFKDKSDKPRGLKARLFPSLKDRQSPEGQEDAGKLEGNLGSSLPALETSAHARQSRRILVVGENEEDDDCDEFAVPEDWNLPRETKSAPQGSRNPKSRVQTPKKSVSSDHFPPLPHSRVETPVSHHHDHEASEDIPMSQWPPLAKGKQNPTVYDYHKQAFADGKVQGANVPKSAKKKKGKVQPV
ncbi:unnamed protein product [Cyprideis torosa]|uniref:Uncharacterized protein n=1 Tax=Cyprideis torosa TaxID=163714 RepID=A0A7R8ZKS9_9CRUS|nr:unnamed protein product [Cyprideis torosa]CAG0885058.1 unnamed protein product [Cyprideis torosa]